MGKFTEFYIRLIYSTTPMSIDNGHYAITAKKTRKPVSKQHYLDYLDYLTDHGEVTNVNFETTRGLHIHFIFEPYKMSFYNILKPTKYGWNVKAVPIFNRSAWLRYSRKDHEKNEQLNESVEKYDRCDSPITDVPNYNLFKRANSGNQ